jgi:DNA repair protein RecO (recombination protein O)
MLAVTLERRAFRDFDQLVTLYTKERGKVTVLARGSKKSTSKNASLLEPLFLVEVDCADGKDMLHLIKVFPVESFGGLLESYEKMRVLGYSASVVNTLVDEGEPDERIFILYLGFLRELNVAKLVDALVVAGFLVRLFEALGSGLTVATCVRCGSQKTALFAPYSGGMVCEACSGVLRAQNEPLMALNEAEQASLGHLVGGSPQEARQAGFSPKIMTALKHFFDRHSTKKLPDFPL